MLEQLRKDIISTGIQGLPLVYQNVNVKIAYKDINHVYIIIDGIKIVRHFQLNDWLNLFYENKEAGLVH